MTIPEYDKECPVCKEDRESRSGINHQYIITKEKIQTIRDYFGDEQDSDELRFAAFDVLDNLSPYNLQVNQEKYEFDPESTTCQYCSAHKNEQHIRKDEQEKLLDIIVVRIQEKQPLPEPYDDWNSGVLDGIEIALNTIDELKVELWQKDNEDTPKFIFCNTPAHAFRLDLKHKLDDKL